MNTYILAHNPALMADSILVVISFIAYKSFYFIVVAHALKKCSEENRKLSLDELALELLPVFGKIWAFIVFHRTFKSLNNELKQKKKDTLHPFAYIIGISYYISNVIIIQPAISFSLFILSGFEKDFYIMESFEVIYFIFLALLTIHCLSIMMYSSMIKKSVFKKTLN